MSASHSRPAAKQGHARVWQCDLHWQPGNWFRHVCREGFFPPGALGGGGGSTAPNRSLTSPTGGSDAHAGGRVAPVWKAAEKSGRQVVGWSSEAPSAPLTAVTRVLDPELVFVSERQAGGGQGLGNPHGEHGEECYDLREVDLSEGVVRSRIQASDPITALIVDITFLQSHVCAARSRA